MIFFLNLTLIILDHIISLINNFQTIITTTHKEFVKDIARNAL